LLLQRGQAGEALKQFEAALALDPSQKAALRDRDAALTQLHEQLQTR